MVEVAKMLIELSDDAYNSLILMAGRQGYFKRQQVNIGLRRFIIALSKTTFIGKVVPPCAPIKLRDISVRDYPVVPLEMFAMKPITTQEILNWTIESIALGNLAPSIMPEKHNG